MIDTLIIVQPKDPYDSEDNFSEDLFVRDEDIKERCDICGEEISDSGYFECRCYSPCCGERMKDDSDICPYCKEHI